MPFQRAFSRPFAWFSLFVVCAVISQPSALRLRKAVFAAPPPITANTLDRQHPPASKLYQWPLSFEENRGQTDPRVRFLARGPGAMFFLAADEAVLRVVNGQQNKAANVPATLRWRLRHANPSARISGLNATGGQTSYFNGHDPSQWRTGLRHFSRVKYEAVYPGIDLVYYGQQQQLEYDFVVASGANPRQIRLAFDGIRRLRIDRQGNLSLRTRAGTVQMRAPAVYQPTAKGQRRVRARYQLFGKRQVGFAFGKYDRRLPLVIDPVLIYATPLGGNFGAAGYALALDAQGSAYVAGATSSTEFPYPNSLPSARGALGDVFVAKLNPAGNALVFAAIIGGSDVEHANGLALDAQNNVYLTGRTFSPDYPRTPGALKTTLSGDYSAFVTKLNASGNALLYSTYLGGNNNSTGWGIATDAQGRAFVAGSTDASEAPLASDVTVRGGQPFFSSGNGGGNWTPGGGTLTPGSVNTLAVAPDTGQTIYADTSAGLFKSLDGGATWRQLAPQLRDLRFLFYRALAVDPFNAETVYASGGLGVYKSLDGGEHFALKTIGLVGPNNSFVGAYYTLAVARSDAQTLYLGTSQGVFRSVDGGEFWTPANNGMLVANRPLNVVALALDPTDAQTVYAGSSYGVFKTTDGGASWRQLLTGGNRVLAIHPQAPLTIYADLLTASNAPPQLLKSTDGGLTWARSDTGLERLNGNQLSSPSLRALAIDPNNPNTLYAGTDGFGIFKSSDGGANWSLSANGLTTQTIRTLAVAQQPARVYAGADAGTDAFVAKLKLDGTGLDYFKVLAGAESDTANDVQTDASGNAWLVGTTNSSNFPTLNALHPQKAAGDDVFISKLDATGNLAFSTFLGGQGNDDGAALALDADGNVYLTGTTNSTDFPASRTLRPANAPLTTDAFAAKLKADGSALDYAVYLGGSRTDTAADIAVDAQGQAFVIGTTDSADFPVRGAISERLNLGNNTVRTDAFVTRLNRTGTAFLYSTYLGGVFTDTGAAIAVDALGQAYVTGRATVFPYVNPIFQAQSTDAFVAKLALAPELAITLTAASNPVTFGNNLSYTLTVTNNGDNKGTGVSATFTPPAGAQPVSAAASQGMCSNTANDMLNCTLGELNPEAQAAITIIVKPPAVRTVTASASVRANEPEANLLNNNASASSEVDFVELSLQNSLLYNLAAPGSRLTYVLRVTNNSGSTASNVVITDTLPLQLTFASCRSLDGGVCGGTGNTRMITFPTLPVGESRTAFITATVNSNVPSGTVINNPANVAATLIDAAPGNNTASAGSTVAATLLSLKNNGKFAYTENSQILTTPPGGGEYTPIQFGSAPLWSPDGTQLLFQYGGGWAIANADGTGARRLLAASSSSQSPTWSPGGQWLAFPRNSDLFVVNQEGANETLLLPGIGALAHLTWSPDGSSFAFVQAGDLYTINIDGSGRQQLTNWPGEESAPRWSPDGRQLLFVGLPPGSSFYTLYRINADGSDPQRMVNGGTYFATPVWSPDGTQIAFVAAELPGGTSTPQLYRMNLDGTGLVNLTLFRAASSCDWQPLPANTPLTPGPLPQTYTISGRLTTNTANAEPVNALVRLTGTRDGTVTTESDGSFTLGNLPAGGHYTVTPASRGITYAFNPIARSFENLRQHAVADFRAARDTYSISGLITDTAATPLAGVAVTLTASPLFTTFATTTTNAEGRYTFAGLPGGEGYIVTPTATFIANFQPRIASIQPLNRNFTANFTGTRHQPFTIRGKIAEASGAPSAGVLVTLSGGSQPLTTTTDTQGNYAFANLVEAADYTLTPQKAGLRFAPVSRALNQPRSDRNVNFTAGAGVLTAISAASYQTMLGQDSIIAAFGTGLATALQTATTTPLPMSLAGVTLTVQDNEGVERPAPLFFVAPTQLNFLLPAGTSVGTASFTVTQNQRIVAAGTALIRRNAPGFFAANASGGGVAAALLARLTVTGQLQYDPVARFDPQLNRFVPIPIDISQPFAPELVLFGTGFRYARDTGATPPDFSLKIGGTAAQATFVGAQGSLAGLDQLNLALPLNLAGRGVVDVVLTVEGRVANTVQIAIK
ncbi:MAG: SBBP repeat-containing protein [Acidobacteria bacterium]|nr:SBBP repeat-containing protein [Acidobacteriota bacterium]MBI3424508.1 SBBP repeat-containing protein [Acidobacteriota bacterium]